MATQLSHEDLRMELWEALEKAYGMGCPAGEWPVLVETFDGYCIARVRVDEVYDLYQVRYAVGDDGEVSLGEARPVEKPYVYKGTVQRISMQADQSLHVIANADAAALLAGLEDENPLFSVIKGTPNFHPVVLDLTTAGRPSQHAGPLKYQLAQAGLSAAMPSLIGKPIHVTAGLDGHFEGAPKVVGVFLGCLRVENEDKTTTVRAVGTLFEKDFPELVEELQERQAELGASYELEYSPLAASRISPDVLELHQYVFSGGAILLKAAAAHPETALLMAGDDADDDGTVLAAPLTTKDRNALPDSAFALIQNVDGRKVRRFPINDEAHRKNAWARVNQSASDLTDAERAAVKRKILSRARSAGDAWVKNVKASVTPTPEGRFLMSQSARYPAFAIEQESAIDAIVTAALQKMKNESESAAAHGALQTELQTAKDELALAQRDIEAAKVAQSTLAAEKAADQTKIAELTTQLDAATTKLAEVEAATAAAEIEAAVAAKLTEYAGKYGWDKKTAEAQRPIVAKIVAAKEVLTLEETEKFASACQAKSGARTPAPVPLMAGGGDGPQFTQEDVVRTFPALRRHLPAAVAK